jgi:hypothetical protein
MNWKLTFSCGFIYSSLAVLFGWLIHKLSGIQWIEGVVLVIVLDVAIRTILNIAARRYLKSVERKYNSKP